ncbi:MAG: family 10 glycosylhydrolase [Phycisphaerae bacterium]|nr:family 10 glycosylhydrolase [Phycisphaerae bacterium]
MSQTILLSSPVTHVDWISKYQKQIGHGAKSVRIILDRCKSIGLQRVYWRCFDGGLALYNSKLMYPESKGSDLDDYRAWASPEKPRLDVFSGYKNFDSLKEAVRYGHKIGLEVHAWLSINEDDHAWGIQSRFTKEHPQFRWVKRSGMPYNEQLSFAFPEVRKYKLALVKEILAYDVDGFFFDWIRTGDLRNGPQADKTGTADFGYEKPLVEAYQKKYGKHPREVPNNDETWVQFRCEPQSLFMKDAHTLIKKKSKSLPISMMGHNPWSYRGDGTDWIHGNKNGLLLDVALWAKRGWVDEVVAACYFSKTRKGGTPDKAFKYMRELVKGRCNVWTYEQVPWTVEEVEAGVKRAKRLGATQILYWESDYFGPKEKNASDKARTKRMADYGG